MIGAGITQSVTGGIARGIIASYDPDTFVLKYIQDRTSNLNQGTFDTVDYEGVDSRAPLLSFESSSDQTKSIIATGFTTPSSGASTRSRSLRSANNADRGFTERSIQGESNMKGISPRSRWPRMVKQPIRDRITITTGKKDGIECLRRLQLT